MPCQSSAQEPVRHLTLATATINIQYLDTLIVQQCPLHGDLEGKSPISGA